MSLGSNGVDRVRSLRKILTRLRDTNFCTSAARFAPSFVSQPNGSKFTQMVRNAPNHEFRVQWGGSGMFILKKLWRKYMAWTFKLITQVQPILQWDSCSNKTLPNAPKHYETHQNMSLWSSGVDRVRSLRKIPMRFHGTNFCFNCTSSTRFAPSFV